MDALEDLRAEISEAVDNTALGPQERAEVLASIRTDLVAALSDVDSAIAETEIDPDAPRPVNVELAVAAMRARADSVQEVLDAELVTEAELTEAGIFTTAELNYLAEERLLETAAQELIESGRITEAGEWADTVTADEEPEPVTA